MSLVKLAHIMSEMVMTLCYMVLPVNLFFRALTIKYHSSTGWATFCLTTNFPAISQCAEYRARCNL